MIIEFDINKLGEAPWSRYKDEHGNFTGWHGDLIEAGGCDASEFDKDDVAEVIAWGTTHDRWDGECAGIVRLKDGRLVGWESSWGPTGSGFCEDAYGGTADIIFASDVKYILMHISEKTRELMAWRTTEQDLEFDIVLRDAWLSGAGYFELVAVAEPQMPYASGRVLWLIDKWKAEKLS